MTQERQLRVLLQTGPFTTSDVLARDLKTIPGIDIDHRRLAASLLGGGDAAFLWVMAPVASIATVAETLYRHTTRLKEGGGDNLVILTGGRITSSEKVVEFRHVRCRKQVPLRGKSEAEIREILEGIAEEEGGG